MLQVTTKIDTATVKQGINLRELAGRYTTLHRESASEMAGPCPKCGGNDRFHVKANTFMCRQCHQQWGDAIEFVRWVEGLSFHEAIAKLEGSSAAIPVEHRQSRQTAQDAPQATQSPVWIENATRIADEAHARLLSPMGQVGRTYLLSRGLQPETWQCFKLGYRDNVGLPGTLGNETRRFVYSPQPAIVIPWHDEAGQVIAIRYRFLQSHTYTDVNGHQRQAKQKSETGSLLTGQLYGWPGLFGGCQQWMTLFICEGELNALSTWQKQHDTRLDVMSMGSESQRLTPEMLAIARQYKRVIVWADKNDVAWQLQQAIPGAHAVKSPNGQDANDLLKNGMLGGFLGLARYKAAATDDEKEGLLWDLCDAHSMDTGTNEAIAYIAKQLGKQVPDRKIDV